jgi:hypothetical protein
MRCRVASESSCISDVRLFDGFLQASSCGCSSDQTPISSWAQWCIGAYRLLNCLLMRACRAELYALTSCIACLLVSSPQFWGLSLAVYYSIRPISTLRLYLHSRRPLGLGCGVWVCRTSTSPQLGFGLDSHLWRSYRDMQQTTAIVEHIPTLDVAWIEDFCLRHRPTPSLVAYLRYLESLMPSFTLIRWLYLIAATLLSQAVDEFEDTTLFWRLFDARKSMVRCDSFTSVFGFAGIWSLYVCIASCPEMD